jgi:CheY-like chemotaxis protein
MALTSLVVCADAKAVQVLRRILSDLGIGAEHCGDSHAAAARVRSEPFDAVLVDCQDQHAALELISSTRTTKANKNSLIIGIVDSRDQVRDVFARGANFIVYKPISVERAGGSLRAARSLMRREKRGKERVPLHAQASIDYANTENVPAILLDLSEDGLALQSERKLPPRCKVYFQFNLPGNVPVVRLSGEVVWQDASGRVGIRFADVPQTSRRVLSQWIGANLVRQVKVEPSLPPVAQRPATRANAGFGLLSASSSNRREKSRHACRLGADVYRMGSKVPHRCTLSDISTGGCYVETPEPFPAGTAVQIIVRTLEMKLQVLGNVQATHPGFGMGVEFNLSNPDEREHVQQLIACQLESESLEPGSR